MQGPIDSLNNRNGIWFSYFENGVRNSMTTYNNNGQNHGKSWVNYPSGKRYYEGTWVHGIKTGKWHTYNEDGSLKETKDFKTN